MVVAGRLEQRDGLGEGAAVAASQCLHEPLILFSQHGRD
jgi:hypothetical protein